MSKGKCNGFVLQDKLNCIILVCNRKGGWSFPKGGQEKYDKDQYDGARREFKEESGFTGFTYFYNPDSYLELTDKGNPSCNLFFARVKDEHDYYGFIDQHSDPDNDIIESRWFSLDEIKSLPDNLFKSQRKNICEIALNTNINDYTEIDCFLSQKRHEMISKNMSWCCRHGLDTFKSKDQELSITIEELLKKLNKDYDFIVDYPIIRRIVKDCPKQRFQVNPKTMRIRAAQGHSGGVAKGSEKFLFDMIVEPVQNVMHATDRKALAMIRNTGLSKMARDHIHMCDDRKMLRQGKHVILYIDMENAMKTKILPNGKKIEGIKFYRASNGDILSPGNEEGFIPAEFIIFPTNENKVEKIAKRKEAYNQWLLSGASKKN